MKNHLKGAMVGAVVVGALTLSACGGNVVTTDDESASSANAAAAPAAEASDEIVAAGEAAAEEAGGSTELPDKTIGFVYFGKNGISSQRAYDGAKAAADRIGWELETCDGQGIPVEQQRCATNLLNQNVDALFVNTIEASTLEGAISQASAQDIPIVSFGGALETSDGYAAAYAPDEEAMGAALGEWLMETLPDGGEVVAQTFPAVWATARVDGMENTVDGSGIEVVDTFDANPTDLSAATQRQTAAALSSTPDMDALFITFSTAEIGAAQALEQQFGQDASYPDRPLLMTFYANLPVIDMIRDGSLDAAAENPIEWQGWVAIDQMAEYFARDTSIDSAARPDYGEGLDFWRASVVTAENLPPEGQLLAPQVDFDGFFTAKWQAEFGV